MSALPLGPLQPTPLAGVHTVSSNPVRDGRGEFARLFDLELFGEAHGHRSITQINRSVTTRRGAIRGLHFQHPPAAEAKWVRCLKGRVWDVAVDLRQGSPTFLQHHACELSGEAANAFLIPEGCAHGFQVLEEESELLYLHSAPYMPKLEGALRWDDPALGIPWPLPPTDISERDRSHPLITAAFQGVCS